ncbi:hemerythrin domain-containing protein [Actinoallomurus oryzae]
MTCLGLADSDDRSLICVLSRDHERIMGLLMRLPAAREAGRRRVVDQVTGELIRHAVAEDMYLYPAIHASVPDWAIDMAKETGAHTRIERLLATLAATDTADVAFDALVTDLLWEVDGEIMHEEMDVFPLLTMCVDPQMLIDLGEQVQAFKTTAVVEKTPDTGLSIRYGERVLQRWGLSGHGDGEATAGTPREDGTVQTPVASVVSANAVRAEFDRALREQAAFRRIAVLVARGGPLPQVFAAVVGQIGRLLDTDCVIINRFESDHTTTVVGHWTRPGRPNFVPPAVPSRRIADGSVAAAVARSGRPGRINGHVDTESEVGVRLRDGPVTSLVACPIMVKGRVWGTTVSLGCGPQPANTEARMLQFMVLTSAAITNAETDAELRASRARVLNAADAARSRIERDLHNRLQQRLICLSLELRSAQDALTPEQDALKGQLARTAQALTNVLQDLWSISRGLHPAILSRGGLKAALKSLVRRCPIPVELHVHVGRPLAEPLKVAVYYITCEALSAALAHTDVSAIRLDLLVGKHTVRVLIHDDGAMATSATDADVDCETGPINLGDRVEALGGKIWTTRESEGNRLLITIPLYPGTA